jgi:subfamily B ATP-binding cassette protein MsbA
MRNFVRALKEARRYWPALVGALACSLCVAVLWGANIAALFPIIETTLNGKSLQQWNDGRLTSAKETLEKRESEVAALQE